MDAVCTTVDMDLVGLLVLWSVSLPCVLTTCQTCNSWSDLLLFSPAFLVSMPSMHLASKMGTRQLRYSRLS